MDNIEIIIPFNQGSSEKVDVTWERVEKDTVQKLPPIGYADKLVSGVIKFEPPGHYFENAVTIKIPHVSVRSDQTRSINLFESEDGEIWKQHETRAIEGMDDINEKTVIYTNNIPAYLVLINQLRIERVIVGTEGGSFSSEIHPGAQVTLAEGVLKKEMRFGLQVQLVSREDITEALDIESGVNISPFVSIYPFMKKFHKPLWVTIPMPEINNDTPAENVENRVDSPEKLQNEAQESGTEDAEKNECEPDCQATTSDGRKSSKSSILGTIKKFWRRIRKSKNAEEADQTTSKQESDVTSPENDHGEEVEKNNTQQHDDKTDVEKVETTDEEQDFLRVGRIPKSVRLLASLIDEGKTPVWEDVTDITPLVDEPADIKCQGDEGLTFETTVSGRFCLINVRADMEGNLKELAGKIFVHISKQCDNKVQY